ncbi:hypothetical protein FOZ63_027352 [Perkinsus olseni]|uniref:Uncharacterized protein n=3 Tax=Perkinsus olseni TaxID=32597 RepID=A0A7J6PSL6_PEROL|nr:hypothetical protein FOZ63_027352 [Perkinsus olseni]
MALNILLLHLLLLTTTTSSSSPRQAAAGTRENAVALQVDLRVPFIDVGPHGFCDWASGFTKLLMNGSQAYTVTGCSRTGAVLPSSAKALFKECQTPSWIPGQELPKNQYCTSQCSAVYEHLRLKPVGRKSESLCQCENAVRCVGGLLVPKIPKVNPDETVPEMWKRAIAQADWRFRTATCASCGCSCWLACTPDKLICEKDGTLNYTQGLTYNDVSKYMYDDATLYAGLPSNTRSGVYTLRVQKPVPDFLTGSKSMAGVADWASRNFSERIEAAAIAASSAAMLNEGQGSLRSLILRDENLSEGELLRIIVTVGYMGTLPPHFGDCSKDMVSSVVPSSHEVSVLEDGNASLRVGITTNIEKSVYTLIEAATDGEMGTIFTQCGGMEASWDFKVPTATMRARGNRGDVTPTVAKGLGWWAWMLIGLCIVLFIGLIISLLLRRCGRRQKTTPMPFTNFDDGSLHSEAQHKRLETPTAAVDPASGIPVLPLVKKNSITSNTRSFSQISSGGASSINPAGRAVRESPF